MGNKRRPATASSFATPARKAAFELVRAVREHEGYLASIASQKLSSAALDPSDKAFARLLAQGALSLQVTLDALIDRSLRSPRDIKPDVRDALRLAAYEILYLDKADHAAVDQGVELVRWFAPRATGVANYVLHRIVEEKARFPYGEAHGSLESAALLYGFPLWLATAIKKDIGSRNAHRFMEGSLAAAPVFFTVNACVTSREAVLATLKAASIEYDTCCGFMDGGHGDPDAIFQLARRSDVGSEAFRGLLDERKIVISDRSAQSIVMRVVKTLPLKDAHVLEIGAGRGIKTLQFQSACRRFGIELARYDVLDVNAAKLKQLEISLREVHGVLSSVVAADATKPLALPDKSYDLVFIDAPCTGLGTLRRHPEIKARLKEGDSRDLARIGQAMLAQAAAKVKDQGYLMYATCTILKEENDKTIKRFLASPEGQAFTIIPIGADKTPFFKTPLETDGADLHFAALLCKMR